MAMLTLNGLVQNVYTQPASTDRDTGEGGQSLCVLRSSAKTSWRAVRRSSKWSR